MIQKTDKTIEELSDEFAQADKHLATARKDLDYMKTFFSRFAEITQNFDALDNFYHDETWLNGRDELLKALPNQHFESAGEDSIWDASQEFYHLKIKMMKLMADDLYKTIPEH